MRFRDENGNETLEANTTLDLGDVATKLRVATETTGFRIWLTEGTDLSDFSLVDGAGKSRRLTIDGLQSPEGLFLSMQDFPSGVYYFNGHSRAGVAVGSKVIWLR